MYTFLAGRGTRSNKNQGFALIIALSLMAFVLLLLLSITTLVQVETQSADTGKRAMEARMNAQLGLQVAFGEIQRTLGPDARVSANASVLDSDPSTAEIDGIEHSHWLGVYPTVNPTDVNDSLLDPKALRDWSLARVQWLISGQDKTSLDPTLALTSDAVTLAQFIDDPTIQIPAHDQMGSLAATSLSKAQAELVEIDTGASTSGNYAYWVGDESMKARVNTQASESGGDVLGGVEVNTVQQQQSNYLVTQGTNFSTWLPGYADSLPNLNKVIAAGELESLANISGGTAWENWSVLNQDKFTPYSFSLPVDVVNGRLKKDLTAYFKGTDTRLDGESIIDPRFTVTADRFPTFDLLKQWATMVDDNQTAQEVVAPDNDASNPQHGLHPVITQGAVAMKLSYKIIGDKTFKPVYMFMPQIQLLNPHNVPLEAQDYIIQVGFQFRWWMQMNVQPYPKDRGTDDATWSGGNPEFRSWTATNGQEPLPVHKPAANEDIDYQGNKRFFTFVIKNQAFEPGESLIFYAKPPSSGEPAGVEYNLNSDADTDILNNYSSDEDLNLIWNEGALDDSFFYVVSPSVGTLVKTYTPIPNFNVSMKSESNFRSSITGSGANSDEDLEMHVNLYAFLDNEPLLLHAIRKGQKNERFGNWQRPTFPLSYYQAGNKPADDISPKYGGKNPLVNLGSSMLVSNFDIFDGGSNMNLPPNAGQPHAVLANWNIRNQESFSKSDDWSSGSVEASAWLSTFSFREVKEFLETWEYSDNLYGNPSTDRLGGWHQSLIQGTVYPFFDYPTSPYGPVSMGSFQHANLSVYGWQPTYAFGNAQAPARFDRSLTKDPSNADLYDISYLMNASIWDSCYLSTVPQTGVALESGMRLPNSRQYLTSINGEGPLDPAQLTNTKGFDLSAASIMVHGGFNVNSTSLTAWKAFLSGALGQSVETTHNTVPSNVDTAAAMGRFFVPLLDEPSTVAADRSQINFNAPNSWAATRTLSVDEIDILAKRIVEEVKRRGPFLSLADFVNRRLEPDTNVVGDERVYQEVLGTLQAAINKVTLKDQGINYHYYNNQTGGGTIMSIKPTQDWNSMGFNVSTEAQESMFGAPSSEIASQGGLIHSYSPNFLSQADVLTKIGPSLTVRGDTYVIRSYGDSRNRVTDKVIAKAWCEAVVQRVAEPVDWDGSEAQLIQTQALDDVSQADFGRSFKLVSFRWLTEAEVMPYADDAAIIN
ncbi:MAG: hypothetical protein ACSHX4_07645 [Opitutaceae bacterium]